MRFDYSKKNDFVTSKTKYPIMYIAILATVQFFLLVIFLLFLFLVLFFPGQKSAYSTNISQWLDQNWTFVEKMDLKTLISANGWIWIQQSLVLLAITAFVLIVLTEALLIFNYLELKKNNLLTFKSNWFQVVFGAFFFLKWINLSKNLTKKTFHNHIFASTGPNSINQKFFWLAFKGKTKINFQWWLTLMFYITLFCSTFVFVVTWIDYGFSFSIFNQNFIQANKDQTNITFQQAFIELRPITSTLSYFTNLMNFSVWIYALFNLFKPKAFIFRNNSLTIQLAVYILIVGFVFWTALFNYKDYQNLPISFVLTIFSHGLTPLSFLIYTLFLIGFNQAKPYSFWKSWKHFILCPLTYGAFLYLAPVFSTVSIYGGLTNINPNNQNVGSSYGEYGNPWFLLGVFAFLIAFGFTYFLIWIYAAFLTKKINLSFSNK